MLVGDERIFLFYLNNKIPTLCTNETGRTLPAGMYINKALENSRRDCATLMPLLIKIGKQFDQNYGRNSLHIVTRETDCQHLYSLFFNLDEPDFFYFILNNSNLVNDFINQYNFTAKDIILEAKSEKNRVVLPTSSTYFDNANQSNLQVPIVHKQFNIPVYLSSQQTKCLLLLTQGKSAKEISIEMQLSSRTVEHYLENVRKQLGCRSNKELIAKYAEQLPRV